MRDESPSPAIPLYSEFILLGSNHETEVEPESDDLYLPLLRYSDFISKAEQHISDREEVREEPLNFEDSKTKVVEIEPVCIPSYLDFLSKAEEAQTLTGSLIPTYSEFLLAAENRSHVPTYHEFLTAYDHYSPVDEALDEKPEPEPELETETAEPPDEHLDEETLEESALVDEREESPYKASKTGLALAVSGSVLGWGSIATSIAASRYVEWYMFVPAVVALILAIVGERVNRRSKHSFYVNTVVFSIFACVFPLILLAVGWLEL